MTANISQRCYDNYSHFELIHILITQMQETFKILMNLFVNCGVNLLMMKQTSAPVVTRWICNPGVVTTHGLRVQRVITGPLIFNSSTLESNFRMRFHTPNICDLIWAASKPRNLKFSYKKMGFKLAIQIKSPPYPVSVLSARNSIFYAGEPDKPIHCTSVCCSRFNWIDCAISQTMKIRVFFLSQSQKTGHLAWEKSAWCRVIFSPDRTDI